MRVAAFLTKRRTGAAIGLFLVMNTGSVGRAAVNGWTPSGSFGGHIRALAIDPSNPTTL